jgi:hypothetical protein
MTKFRKVELKVTRGSGYGQYIVTGIFANDVITAKTTDSEIFDWLDDDSNKEKHQEAKKAAYSLIKRAIENK